MKWLAPWESVIQELQQFNGRAKIYSREACTWQIHSALVHVLASPEQTSLDD